LKKGGESVKTSSNAPLKHGLRPGRRPSRKLQKLFGETAGEGNLLEEGGEQAVRSGGLVCGSLGLEGEKLAQCTD